MIKKFIKTITKPETEDRLFLVRVIVCVGLIAGFLSSYDLWINSRFYPLSPATGFIPVLSPPFDNLLFLFIVALLAVIIFYPKKVVFAGFFISTLWLALQDQTRLQPWFFHYLFLLGAVAWYESTPHRNNARSAAVICRTVLIGIYLWSGLHKFNYVYLFETFEWMAGPALEISPFIGDSALPFLAAASAVVEAGAGISLIFQSTRRFGAWILILMHFFILWMVGPGGLAYNSVVWPWNVCFILLLAALFLGRTERFGREPVFVPNSYYHGLVLLLFLILPVLNFWNLWDHFPSESLYSGKKPRAVVNVSNAVRERFPKRVQPEFNDLNQLIIRDWALAELNVPDYPQPRIYKHIFRELCTYEEREYALTLEIYDTADLITGKRETEILFCQELQPDPG